MLPGVLSCAGGGVYVNGFLCGAGLPCTSTVPFSPDPATGSRFSIMGGSPWRVSADVGPADVSRFWSLPAGCTATAPMIPAVSTKAAAVPVTNKRLRTLRSPCGSDVARCPSATALRPEGPDGRSSGGAPCTFLRGRAFEQFRAALVPSGVPDGTIRGRTTTATGTCNTRSKPARQGARSAECRKIGNSEYRLPDILPITNQARPAAPPSGGVRVRLPMDPAGCAGPLA